MAILHTGVGDMTSTE